MHRILDLTTSIAATLVRAGGGLSVGRLGPRPEKLLDLYEFEGCPYCRKVREALSALDLDAMIHPCPKQGPRFREQVIREGGKAQFPWLVDPNTEERLYESDEIVEYLYEHYGDGEPPWTLSLGPLTDLGVMAVGALRPGAGMRYRAAKPPARPLELWSFEASPYCRLVRETLCELELPYRLHNVAKGSPSRPAFLERAGRIQVPYLVDPNTGTELFESADINTYLESTYAQ